MRTTRKKNSHKHGKTHKHHKCCHSTMMGLQIWYKKMFEQLGWMVLAKDRGLYDKIAVYKNSVKRLKDSIEMKLEKVKEADRKADLRIMHRDVCCLMEHVHKDFP